MGGLSKEFGTVPMTEEIATPEDISSVVKGVTELPTRSVANDVVQLTGVQAGYQTGAYYRYDEPGRKWVKVEHGVQPLDPINLTKTLEAVDDHTRLTLKVSKSTEIEDYLQVIFKSAVGELVLAQFSHLSGEYALTLPEAYEVYAEGTFLGRVVKNGYTSDFIING